MSGGGASYPFSLANDQGEVLMQFHHVIYIAPTVLEASALPEPKVVNGTEQAPLHLTT